MFEDVFAILDSTPAKLQREVNGLSLREMKARPAPDKWSIQIVLAHLDDVEEVGMRSRVAAMVGHDRPVLKAFDQLARVAEQRYERKDPQETLDSFSRQRRKNLRWLRKLRPADFSRKGIHETAGEISVAEMVTEWAFHDLGHLKQILEIKRSALYPKIGNMRVFYPTV